MFYLINYEDQINKNYHGNVNVCFVQLDCFISLFKIVSHYVMINTFFVLYSTSKQTLSKTCVTWIILIKQFMIFIVYFIFTKLDQKEFNGGHLVIDNKVKLWKKIDSQKLSSKVSFMAYFGFIWLLTLDIININ